MLYFKPWPPGVMAALPTKSLLMKSKRKIHQRPVSALVCALVALSAGVAHAQDYRYKVLINGLVVSPPATTNPDTPTPPTSEVPGTLAAVRTKVSPPGVALNWTSVESGTAETLNITLRNDAPSGGDPLTVTTLVSGSASFSVSSNTCENTAPGALCEISVRYAPPVAGTQSGTLTLQSSGDENLVFSLSGSAIEPTPKPAIRTLVSPSTQALAWGNTEVGSSKYFEITFRNDGGEGALPLSVSAQTSGHASFHVAGNTCTAVITGALCKITVGYTPSATGAHTGTLTLGSEGHDDLVFTLSGTGAGDPYWSSVTTLLRFNESTSPFANTKTPTYPANWSSTGAAFRDTNGKFGTAANMNGVGRYLVMGWHMLSLSNTTPVTIETWARFDSAPAVTAANWQGARMVTRLGDGTSLDFYFQRHPVQAGAMPNYLCFGWSDSAGTYRSATRCQPVTVTTGQWLHVAVSHDGGTVPPRLFLNGQMLSGGYYTNPDNLSLRTAANNGLFIGAHPSSPNYQGYFPGALDDLRITVGVSRHTDSFMPPVTAYPAY